jgi:valine--pyruvate aminotransferase
VKFSKFGQKFTRKTGILQLMDDLGNALAGSEPVLMLGGGNPARLPEVNAAYERVMRGLLDSQAAVESVGNYSTPQGDAGLIDALADFLRQEYGWHITRDNIALTNGSQNAFFYLFNLFGGAFEGGDKKILLPLAPEYVGYADAHIDGQHFLSVPPKMEDVQHEGQDGFFKYRVDFETLEHLPEWDTGEIGAICCSRPTNPTGNVLTDEEMARLDALAQRHGIPLIVDNAYGMPFPSIIHTDATLTWHDNMILCFSLSKIGLPGVRTGIIVAATEVVRVISSMNAVINLAPTRFGAAIATPMLRDGSLKQLSQHVIRPFYRKQVAFAANCLKREFAGYPLKIHRPEGAIFLWLWFDGLPVSSQELYEQLKAAGTLIIPGEHFFVGMDTGSLRHARECIRMSIAQDEATLREGIATIGRVVRGLYDAAR